MFLAKIDDNLCGAKYYYKNNSIYFNSNYPLANAATFALHECIHYLQSKKDNRGNLVRLGLYDYPSNIGIAINEASVQLMTSIASKAEIQNVTYYNIDIHTESPDCYPLECAIVRQMAYFTGTYPLFHSTIYSDDIFKNTFITISSKKAYDLVESNLDMMLELENELSMYFAELKYNGNNATRVKNISSLINECKKKITKLFFNCQNTIISHCFSYDLNSIHNSEDIKQLKKKIYDFKNLLGTNSTYEFYNEFYRKLMEALDEKNAYLSEHSYLEINTETKDLTVYKKTNKAFALIRKLFIKLGLVKELY